jgi:hypothetical protein
MSVRTAQAVTLWQATIRSVGWPPALAAVLVVTGLTVWWRGAFDALGSAVTIVRVAAVLLALGAGFVLDDAAAPSVAASPTPLWWRRMIRYGIAAVFVLPAWATLIGYAYQRQPEVPAARLTLELTVLVICGLATAGAAARWFDTNHPGTTAALSVLGFVLLAAYLPPRFGLFASPGSSAWGPSALRWAGVLAVLLAVLVASSHDPARPSPRRALRRTSPAVAGGGLVSDGAAGGSGLLECLGDEVRHGVGAHVGDHVPGSGDGLHGRGGAVVEDGALAVGDAGLVLLAVDHPGPYARLAQWDNAIVAGAPTAPFGPTVLS